MNRDIAVTVNGEVRRASVMPRMTLVDLLRDVLGLTGTHIGCEHGVCGACSILLDGVPVRSCLIFAVQADGHEVTTVEGLADRPGEIGDLQDAFWECHAMQCGYCTPGMLIAGHALLEENPEPATDEIREAISGNLCRCTGYTQIVEAIALCAARRNGGDGQVSDRGHGANYRYVSQKRRTKEDRRFIAGKGRFAADVAVPGMKHVALVASPHPRANILSIDAGRALASPGVHAVLTGDELSAETAPLFNGLDIPNVKWFPLAVGMTRYAGEWVAAVVADSRYLAEDAAELVEVDYEPLPAAVEIESLLEPDSPLVHPDHGSNVLVRKTFEWGPVEEDFAKSEQTLSYRARWGRSSTVPIETFGVVSRWDPIREILDVWASIQMPNYQEQIANALGIPTNSVRVHNDVDVGGSYGVKRGIKHTVITGYLTRKLGMPVRLIEDRLDNMSGGDAHGPDRLFDVTLAFDGDGTIHSMKLRAIDDVGAYPGRGPLQLGKPITALVGPYRLSSVAYEAISVTSNKTGQVPVRGFGQSPTNFMIETGVDLVARRLGIDRIEIRRRNLIGSDEFPWRIPTGTEYDSGDYHAVLDKALGLAGYDSLVARRDAARAAGRLAGIGVATCLEPGGGNNIFEQLLNEKLEITTFVESCLMRVDMHGNVTAVMSTTTSGQGHETLIATIAGEELERDPDTIRVTHADSLEALPTRSPVASRMAIVLGSATSEAARKIRAKMVRIAAHNLGVGEDRVEYQAGTFFVRGEPARKLEWNEIASIAHTPVPPPAARHRALPAGILRPPGAGRLGPAAEREAGDPALPLLLLPGARPLCRDRPRHRQGRSARLRDRPRLRHGDQSRHRARHDRRRARARDRRGALREIRL